MQTKLWHTGNLGPYMAESFYCDDEAFHNRSRIWSSFVYKPQFGYYAITHVNISHTEIYVWTNTCFFTHANIHPIPKKGNFLYRSTYALYRIECILYRFTHWRVWCFGGQHENRYMANSCPLSWSICLKDWCKTYNIQIWPPSQI